MGYAMGFPHEWDHDTVELCLHTQNTRAVWSRRVEPMFRAAQRHYNRGTGSRDRLVAGLVRIVGEAARDYHREHGTPGDRWHDLFPVASRHAVAEYLADYFLEEREAGNTW